MKPSNFRKPPTGEAKLIVQFRNGETAQRKYTAAQLRWSDSGSDWDIIAYRRADGKSTDETTWNAKSGGY